MTRHKLILVGGGVGGADGPNGAGGLNGAYLEFDVPASAMGATAAVTVGAGGVHGLGAGGDSTVATTTYGNVTAKGGTGGTAGNLAAFPGAVINGVTIAGPATAAGLSAGLGPLRLAGDRFQNQAIEASTGPGAGGAGSSTGAGSRGGNAVAGLRAGGATANPGAGAAGAAGDLANQLCGAGGGGGGGGAGNGGAGGKYGGGGGGSAGSNLGGSGGQGGVVIISYFD